MWKHLTSHTSTHIRMMVAVGLALQCSLPYCRSGLHVLQGSISAAKLRGPLKGGTCC